MKILIIDDEKLAIDFLERQLLHIPGIEIVGKYTDVHAGKEHVLQLDVDVLFLDISLPEINGLELAEQIAIHKPNISIVFVTAYNDYAVQAYELEALDYVVKPVSVERLTKTIERIQNRMRSQQIMVEPPKQPSGPRIIEMKLFRQVMIEEAGGELRLLQWRTNKAQELFMYLLQHRGRPVQKSMLIEVLWPEHELDKILGQLYNTVYHVRQALRPYQDHVRLETVSEGYILQLQNVLLDVDEWKKLQALLTEPSASVVHDYVAVMNGYTGHYLAMYDYWWLEAERERLKEVWLDVSFALANWYREQGLIKEEEQCYWKIVEIIPHEERAGFALMLIYATQGLNTRVIQCYSRLKNSMYEELGLEPSPHITHWYEKWQKDISLSMSQP
ncbi:response regulator [Paenibacillus sp. FSL K6-1230]|uniref:response regulator n=1 Tax=Paenibacillus sp. FSL K6-1230 TaxID=2921603 RepID=UPI0030FB7962